MTDKPTFLTAAGKRKLEEELQYLRTVRRPAIAAKIHEAKEGGDIMENAGYDAAKDEQAFVEGRILTLEALLSKVEIIKESNQADTVDLGSSVTVLESGGNPETFTVVGPTESDPSQGRISHESPLGRALLGHRVGERVTVQSPSGVREFEILDVR
jgi:transcription elongation factor GreA